MGQASAPPGPAAAAPGAAAAGIAEVDRAFAARAMATGLAEVAMGSLAETRAQSDAVRRFAGRMVEDHGRANAELLQWARERGVELPQRPDAGGQREIDHLVTLQGEAFDRAYMGRMVNDHRLSITHADSIAATGRDAALKAWALRSLPMLRAHLHAAQTTHVAANEVRPSQVRAGPAQGRDVRASRLIGKDVLGEGGEAVGRLVDLVVDLRNERVQYAVLSFGGVFGVGNKHFAFPLSAFRIGVDGEHLLLPGVAPERLSQAPGFEPDRWPDWNAPGYVDQVARFHGPDPRVVQGPNAQLVRASWLMGKDIDDRTGAAAGEVEDLVLDLVNARLRYAVVDFDPGWLAGERLVPLPMRALVTSWDPHADLVLSVPRERLERRRGWTEDRWPDLNEPAFRRELDDRLRRMPGPRPVHRG